MEGQLRVLHALTQFPFLPRRHIGWRLGFVLSHAVLTLTFLAGALWAEAAAADDPPDLPPPASESAYSLPSETDSDQLPPGAATSYLLGKTLLEKGDYREALPYLNQAYRLSPEVERVSRAYIAALLGVGAHRDALPIIDRLLVTQPEDQELRRVRVRVLMDSGRFEEALTELEVLAADGEHDADLMFMTAAVLAREGQTDRALELYRQALAEFPEHREQIYMMMASTLETQRQTEQLDALLQEALGELPYSRPIRLAYLQFLLRGQRLDKAAGVADAGDRLLTADLDSVRADPSFTSPPEGVGFSYAIELADMLVRIGRYGEAADILQRRFEAGTLELTGSIWLCRLLLGMGRGEEAQALLAEVQKRWPESGQVEYLWASALAAEAQLEAALEHAERAVVLEPLHGELRVTHIRLLLLVQGKAIAATPPTPEQQEIQSAFRDATKATATVVAPNDSHGHLVLGYAFQALRDLEQAAWHFRIAGENEELRRDAGVQLSLCQEKLGQSSRARKTLADLWREYPDDTNLANSYGYFLAEKGLELDLAEELIRLALAEDPDNGAYLDSMAWVYYQRQQFAEAFDLLVRAANALPEDPVILEHLGLTLSELGQTDEALVVLRRSLAAGGEAERLDALIAELETAERTGEEVWSDED